MSMPIDSAHPDTPLRIVASKKSDRSGGCESFISFPFELSCNLAEHPLFKIQRLSELANFISTHNSSQVTYVATGENTVHLSSQHLPQGGFPELASQLGETDLLMFIDGAQEDVAYKQLLEQIVDELEELTEQSLRQQNTWLDAYIFITSTNLVAKHSINHKSNFLFRIREKDDRNEKNDCSISISVVYSPKGEQIVNFNLFSVIHAQQENGKTTAKSSRRAKALVRKIALNDRLQAKVRLEQPCLAYA